MTNLEIKLRHDLGNAEMTIELLLHVLQQWSDGDKPEQTTNDLLRIARKQGRVQFTYPDPDKEQAQQCGYQVPEDEEELPF